MYNKVTTIVTSDSYKARSIEIDTDASTETSAAWFSTQLGMLHDKLVLLKLLSGITTQSSDWQTVVSDINNTINQLRDGGAATGLFGQTNIGMRPEDFALQPTLGDIFSDQELNDKWTTDAVMHHSQSRVPNATVEYDYRSRAADKYLLDSAKSLGLFTQPSDSQLDPSTCVIL